MKPAPFRYHDPGTVEEAAGLLAELGDAKLLAGGQSLMPMLNMRFLQPEHVVDLNGIGELAGIERNGDAIRIGAMTRQRDLMRSDLINTHLPIMAETLTWVGHFQTRNRGTIGGSLCHLDPAAELPVVAALYDAEISVRGKGGGRDVAFAEWPLAYMMPSMTPEELATAVTFVVPGDAQGYAFVEYARRHGDFAMVAVGCLLTLDDKGSVQSARLAVGGADQVVRRASNAEASLAGARPDAETWRAAGEAAAAEIETMGDAYASAGYRARLVRVLVERALSKAASRAIGVNGGSA